MVIDTSAIVAILFRETEASRFNRLIAASPFRSMSAVTRVELACVIEGRKGDTGRRDLASYLANATIETVDVTQIQVEFAIDAFRRFGKGRHPAGLNIGDCFSYALAKALNQPLLFKGADFGLTDIVPAAPSLPLSSE